ncbi:hypothetical protein JR316_0000992 [Psilocybe cubensis]|uniref:Uncharacterized protein n=2 Tax=Psilocybe cubensis TaxID=181762 RepID=A0A8H8CQT7_PSICU|nr:hypothetical protein JR316_0000992 [Psilocybe cubensis]KAH9486926.1 hypothetical protein JR316_0000992 [Psilocybe cubensis]
MDFVQTLDPSKLVLAGTGLSFVLSIAATPPYNLAIFLFGCYAQEAAEGSQSLQTFTGLLGVSTIFDVVWMIKNEQAGFFKFLTVVLLLLKLPTFFAFANALRQRGGQFSGLGAANLGGPTVWSMPGGFTSNGREGYQTVDDDTFVRNIRTAPSVPHKSAQSAEAPAAPGAYQSV